MSVAASQGFYGRWAALYDVLSHSTPGITHLRQQAIDGLGLSTGDTVVDLGCGSGANVPALRQAVGSSGQVIGVDFTGPILQRARARHDHEGVSFVRGDVTNLPIEGSVDAVFASFLSGMLPEPTLAVDAWAAAIRSGGALGLLDASLSDARTAWPANQLVKGVVFASSPRKGLDWDVAPWTTVTRRVKLAHAAIRRHASETTEDSWAMGTIRVTTGEIE